MVRILRLLLVSALLALGGCSMFGSEPATEGTRIKQLKLPPDLVLRGGRQPVGVPDTTSATASGAADEEPVLPRVTDVEVRAAGDDRWLLVNAPPDQVWDRLDGFLASQSVEVARRRPAAGILETDWVYSRRPLVGGAFAPTVADAEQARVADRYLFRLEPGVESGTTEVFVAHRRAARDEADEWTLRPSDPFLEAELLRGLMVFLGEDRSTAATEIAAASGEPRARLDRNETGKPVLRLEVGFFDAWRRVGLALDRAGFTVSDRDRSARVYLVRYDARAEQGPEEEGFLESLAFWSEDIPDTVHRYRLTLTEEPGGATRVEVDAEEGEPADPELAARILGLLEEQLR